MVLAFERHQASQKKSRKTLTKCGSISHDIIGERQGNMHTHKHTDTQTHRHTHTHTHKQTHKHTHTHTHTLNQTIQPHDCEDEDDDTGRDDNTSLFNCATMTRGDL